MKCWNCNEAVQGPVCAGCSVIQKLRPTFDHFALLGLPRTWKVDKRDIERAWRRVQKKVHPDRYVSADAAQRQLALQWTASLNEARRVLKTPRTRALYLATGQPELPESAGGLVDPDFLDQMFELQLAASEEPERVQSEADAFAADIDAQLDGIFEAWQRGEGSLEGVAPLIARMKYIDNARALVA